MLLSMPWCQKPHLSGALDFGQSHQLPHRWSVLDINAPKQGIIGFTQTVSTVSPRPPLSPSSCGPLVVTGF